ncbi:MAG: cardiolipin synthase [Faecalibacterium sp.]
MSVVKGESILQPKQLKENVKEKVRDFGDSGLNLLKKGQKGMIHAIFSRLGLILLLFLLQVGLMVGMFHWFSQLLPHYYGLYTVVLAVMVLHLLNTDMDNSAKITWLVVIMIMPVVGVSLFAYVRRDVGHNVLKRRLKALEGQTSEQLPQSKDVVQHLQEQSSPGVVSLTHYLRRWGGGFPIYENTEVTYFPGGEEKFEEMLRQLETAQKYIFLEYFIIDEGLMWGKVLEILARKAAEGVDVRVMYDGTCEFSTLPRDYPTRLAQLGIRCKVFSPMTPFVSTHYNYRDHRKILVIDGQVGFTGGVNLADEYINRVERFGRWKDAAIMLRGEGVRSLTALFLQMWGIMEKEPEFEQFLNQPILPCAAEGFVAPYGDCPLDSERVGEMVYIDLLNRAQRYVHIITPYLILDGELEAALKFAAERGVDVHLILPGIPDKKSAYALAKTHYSVLLKAGVKISEYTPGFVHAKVFVVDDSEAVVGTINLDYRSLYHHFECAVWMVGTRCIPEIEKDFQNTLAQCRTVHPNRQSIWQGKTWLRLTGHLLKVIAPLL